VSLRTFVKSELSKRGLHVGRIPRSGVGGVSLLHDLRMLIQSSTPTLFDVGANKGQTIEMLRTVFPESIIYAFEPSSVTFQELAETSKRFGNHIKLFQCAVGEKDDEAEFINYEWSTLSSFFELEARTENPFREVARGKREKVSVRSIDSVMAENELSSIDLLKIDTQGYEIPVLNGALTCLQNGIIKNVLAELTFAPLYQGQSNSLEVMRLLETHNFSLVDFYEKTFDGNRLAWCTALFRKH